MVGGVPLYTFDKHTSIGKRAVTQFYSRCAKVRRVLNHYVPEENALRVAHMAVFYADSVPVSNRLNWTQSTSLETLGFEADMTGAGCPPSGMKPILESVRRNLGALNDARRFVLRKRV